MTVYTCVCGVKIWAISDHGIKCVSCQMGYLLVGHLMVNVEVKGRQILTLDTADFNKATKPEGDK